MQKIDIAAIREQIESGSPTQLVDLLAAGHHPDIVETVCRASATDLLNALVGKCGDFILSERYPGLPIFDAVSGDHLETVKRMVELGFDPCKRDNVGATPVFVAKSVEMLDFLVSAGCDINHRDNEGETMLVCSAAFNVDVLSRALELGADPNAKDNDGSCPISYAIHYSSPEIIITLLENGAQMPEYIKGRRSDAWDNPVWFELKSRAKNNPRLADIVNTLVARLPSA